MTLLRSCWERYLKIYEPEGVYEHNSEGNEGTVNETIITTMQLTIWPSGLTLVNPGVGYTNDVEVGISSPTGKDDQESFWAVLRSIPSSRR